MKNFILKILLFILYSSIGLGGRNLNSVPKQLSLYYG